jgi:magnesium transporter
VVSVVFMPLNVLAGIGGMSEFSMMTQSIAWPISYSFFYRGLGHRWLADLCHFEVT